MDNYHANIVVTGACGGIGKSLCDVFIKKGYYLIAIDRNEGHFEEGSFIQFDLHDLVKKERLIGTFLKEIEPHLEQRPLAGVINNAAIQKLGTIEQLDVEDFQTTLDVNLTVPLLLSKMFLPYLKKSRGSIVNIGSIHANLTKPGFVSYATSKAGLAGLTKSLAVDLGKFGIRVNNIQPAATSTEMLLAGFVGKEESLELLNDFHPLQRIAKPYEIALLAEFLVSKKSNFITGTSIDIDGGIGVRLHDPE